MVQEYKRVQETCNLEALMTIPSPHGAFSSKLICSMHEGHHVRLRICLAKICTPINVTVPESMHWVELWLAAAKVQLTTTMPSA